MSNATMFIDLVTFILFALAFCTAVQFSLELDKHNIPTLIAGFAVGVEALLLCIFGLNVVAPFFWWLSEAVFVITLSYIVYKFDRCITDYTLNESDDL